MKRLLDLTRVNRRRYRESPTKYLTLDIYFHTSPQRTERDGMDRSAGHDLQCGMK